MCDTKIGKCEADAIAEILFDSVSAKYVAVVLPTGQRMEVNTWNGNLKLLEQEGLKRMTQKEFMRKVTDRASKRDV